MDVQTWCDRVIKFLPTLGLGAGIFIASWVAAKIVGHVILQIGKKLDEQKKQVLQLAASTSRGLIIVVGLVTALGTMGIDVSAIVASLGLTGFAVGFALRDALSNVLAGSLILIYQPFQRGDYIAVAGCEGHVAEINLRYTVIRKEAQRFLIPNSTLFTNVLRIETEKRAAAE